MTRNSDWQRVAKARPCPVCGKADWCLYTGAADAPSAAICTRIESAKRCGESGWLHILRHDGPTWAPWRRTIRVPIRAKDGPEALDTGVDLPALAIIGCAGLTPKALDKLAHELGLTAESLTRLGVGWSPAHRAFTFPMSNAAGNVLGIRLRLPSGKKLSVKGGREGLFIPEGLGDGALLITEGPTDAAALLDLGFNAVGRPSCTGGVKLLVELVRDRPEVVIVADGDAPGQRGANNLAVVLAAYAPAVRIITPPAGIKDAREWKRRGATHDDVQAAIDAAEVRTLKIHVQRKAGSKHGK